MSISDLSLASECQNIEVILKNKVLEIQGFTQGIYRLYKTVNGKASWKSTSFAIWYFPNDKWGIGKLKDIGKSTSWVSSTGAQGDKSPYDVPNDKWQYDNGDWKDGDGDIIVQCVNDKGKIILLTLENLAYNPLAFFPFSKAALA